MKNRIHLRKKLLLLPLFLMLAGNGSFSSSSHETFDLTMPIYCIELPMFVHDHSGIHGMMKINPELFKNKDFYQRYHKILADYRIMTKGSSSVEDLASFLLRYNQNIAYKEAVFIAGIYLEEAEKEGVNHDLAFSQMCLETGFLKFQGIVNSRQNNFCGLGAINERNAGEQYVSQRLGIRAHIQHLKAYASREEINDRLVDRRFHFVERGSVSTVDGLTGKWASDTLYAKKIKFLMYRLYLQSNSGFQAFL